MLRACVWLALWLGIALGALDQVFPLDRASLHASASVVVVAQDGTPLRAFPAADGAWSYAVGLDDVSPRYLEALINYEDRWFAYHPGINPFALIRAGWQALASGHIVSGGSTLTMQVARLLYPHERSLQGKFAQMLRALQLEWHLSKDEILSLYLNHAPMGGTLRGVQAGSFAYLGKPLRELTHAEAALLAVLPQAPSRLRPDRYPERATAARNKVLTRLASFGVWSANEVAAARAELVFSRALAQPMSAPLLAQRLKDSYPEESRVDSNVDAALQWRLEQLVQGALAGLAERSSIAIVVMENATLAVRAYVGSADLLDGQRYGHVDMVRVSRSPGSTLKPFLYGLALDEGLIHSESLLVDAPQLFAGYGPGNFTGSFSGPVSASQALQRSLNVPAVDLLDRIGPDVFVAALRNGGLSLALPPGGEPNLAVILGGAGAHLQALVGAYAALARGGIAGVPRLRSSDALQERRLMSEGAAWIVRTILETQPRSGWQSVGMHQPTDRRVAWKTGTSYGFRDAWALGVTERYTVGVWVGRPDGTPVPGHYGAVTAAPLLFAVTDLLPRSAAWQLRSRPTSVREELICWPLGRAARVGEEDLCHEQRRAWVLHGVVPATLPDRLAGTDQGAVLEYWVNPATGLRVDARCTASRREARRFARWPIALQPWLARHWRAELALPPIDPSCPPGVMASQSVVKIAGLDNGTVVRRAGAAGSPPTLTLRALGGEGRLFWLVDGALVKSTGAGDSLRQRFSEPGPHRITVMDGAGNYDQVTVRVLD